MKKVTVFLFVLILLLALSLCACSEASASYTVEIGRKTYEVDPQNGTIFDGVHTYQYTFSGDAFSYNINITYPNGSTYHSATDGRSGAGSASWSNDYNEKIYASGDTLCDVIVAKMSDPVNPAKVIAAIFLIGVGVFHAISPYTAWYLSYGWRYKDAEPSDSALWFTRFGGIIAIIIGVILIFV